MGRPVDADSERTYTTIVDAALGVLDDVGHPDRLSLRKVATVADVSLGTIQYYFPSKRELLEACLDGHYERITSVANELFAAAEGLAGRELVEHAARMFFGFVRRERALIRLRMVTNAELGELHPRRQPEFMGAVIAAATERLQSELEVDPIDARLSIQSMSNVMVRMALLSDSERAHLTGLTGAEAEAAVEGFVVRAARRLVRPSDG